MKHKSQAWLAAAWVAALVLCLYVSFQHAFPTTEVSVTPQFCQNRSYTCKLGSEGWE